MDIRNRKEESAMLIVRGLFGGAFQVALIGTMLLVPAGTWDWPRAIQFLVGYSIVMCVSILALGLLAPASLEARIGAPVAKSQPRADKVASAFLFLSLFAWFVFIPIDVFHLRLFAPPTLWVSICGVVLLVAGYAILLTAMFQNAFAAPIVKDQSERGQVVIDTGLYGRVRHPFYSGLILFLAGLPLWLESYAGVLALLVVLAALGGRIHAEETTLQETLPGYGEYMQKVRFRLVPLVW
jgi:protein-S-isoprenylcysteine O-methyltransferase Ste14